MTTSSFDPVSFLKAVTTHPGVYQMFNAEGELLYVGKARNLKKRLSSYFQHKNLAPKTAALVKKIADIQVIVTQSEDEALLLEYNLIKKYHPKYNIIFRDDKSYPYIVLSKDKFPRLFRQRGDKIHHGELFGPYPQSTVVREVVDLLSKVFKLRTCKNSFFSARSRPCLQYQINRCSAPCVNQISEADYKHNVQYAKLFLTGKSDELIQILTASMEKFSKEKAYEAAAKVRDQIRALRQIQSQQSVTKQKGDLDLLVALDDQEKLFVYLLMIRDGKMNSSRQFYEKAMAGVDLNETLAQFILQYYLEATESLPLEILMNRNLPDKRLLEKILSDKAGRAIKIRQPKRGQGAAWIQMASESAQEIFHAELEQDQNYYRQFDQLQTSLNLPSVINRMECFDISHTMGEATVASCVVFDRSGPLNASYRRYNISDITAGDDFAAMRQVLTRRYLKKSLEATDWPDLIIIDGGKGQLQQAITLFQNIEKEIPLLGVAKGVSRKPGLETLFLAGRDQPIHLEADTPALHLIQQIRDEAHRFAITGHRKKRGKARTHSSLETIEGIGAKKRAALLKHFGGLQGVMKASVQDLAKVDGISARLAVIIYAHLH